MEVVDMDINFIFPYDENPRNNKESVAHVVASIKEFGWHQPIVVDENMVIIIGHTRRLAAIKLKMDTVPVEVASDLTKAQVKALRLADNKAGEKSYWDLELLRSEISDLSGLGFKADMKKFGFEKHELVDVFDGDPEEEEEGNEDNLGDDIPSTKDAVSHLSIKIKFENLGEKSEAYEMLNMAVKSKSVTWEALKEALDL